MQRNDRSYDSAASSLDHRLAPPMRYSLALALAMPLMAAFLMSPAGPALLMSLAALALAVFGL